MEITTWNGVGTVVPAESLVVEPRPLPDPLADPFDAIRATLRRVANLNYANGYRAAVRLLASTIGQLDGESKAKIVKTIDLLEEQLHKADEAAK